MLWSNIIKHTINRYLAVYTTAVGYCIVYGKGRRCCAIRHNKTQLLQ